MSTHAFDRARNRRCGVRKQDKKRRESEERGFSHSCTRLLFRSPFLPFALAPPSERAAAASASPVEFHRRHPGAGEGPLRASREEKHGRRGRSPFSRPQDASSPAALFLGLSFHPLPSPPSSGSSGIIITARPECGPVRDAAAGKPRTGRFRDVVSGGMKSLDGRSLHSFARRSFFFSHCVFFFFLSLWTRSSY